MTTTKGQSKDMVRCSSTYFTAAGGIVLPLPLCSMLQGTPSARKAALMSYLQSRGIQPLPKSNMTTPDGAGPNSPTVKFQTTHSAGLKGCKKQVI